MKKLQLTVKKDPIEREFTFIQVKGGFVNATNKYILIRLPVTEVFGNSETEDDILGEVPLIAETEELYFDGKLWASAKMDKAASIKRDNLIFYALDKLGRTIGTIVATTSLPDGLRYPDVTVVIPEPGRNPVELPCISFNAALLLDLCKAFGTHSNKFTYTFFGSQSCILVTNKESKGVGLLYPTYCP
jgi:hypothetical protein